MDNLFGFTNTEEAKQELKHILAKPEWMESLCRNNHGDMLDFCDDKNFAKLMNDIASFGWFENKEKAKGYLHSCLNASLDEISEWLVDSKRLPLDIVLNSEEVIGKILNEKKEEVDTKKVKLSLRKEIGNKTDYGFYVSFFHPVL